MNELTALILGSVVKISIVLVAVLTLVAYLVYAERKISAYIQDRIGPNRVGPAGLLQPIADGLKFLFKEDVVPGHVHKLAYILAPAIIMIPALLTVAAIPFGSTLGPVKMVIADLDVGILYVFAIASLGVYGIVLGGWASNSKYPLLGAIRSSAQMISYEVCMGLSVVALFMVSTAGTLRLTDLVRYQAETGWFILKQPLAFVLFLVASFAETNRLPFDLPEAETELVGGYHTEYSSLKFGMFFLAEYANMVVVSAMMVTLFFGGWHIPFLPVEGSTIMLGILHHLAFTLKLMLMLFLFIWVRWTLPRFRFDQLMHLGWKVMLPAALLNILVTGIVLLLFRGGA